MINNELNGNWLRTQLNHVQFEEVENAGHFSFIAQFKESRQTVLNSALAGIQHAVKDPEGFDRAKFQRRLETEVVMFFDQALSRA